MYIGEIYHFSVSNDKMDLSDQIAKQDLFSLLINAAICIPKNDMSEVLGIRLFEYSTWISKLLLFLFRNYVKQVFS
jgi:hypothetical protein